MTYIKKQKEYLAAKSETRTDFKKREREECESLHLPHGALISK